MSISMSKPVLVRYLKSLKQPVPAIVQEAKPSDVFAWGFGLGVGPKGRMVWGSLPIHKIGSMVRGKFVSLAKGKSLQKLDRDCRDGFYLSLVPQAPRTPKRQLSDAPSRGRGRSCRTRG
jgi:hypothetical protein